MIIIREYAEDTPESRACLDRAFEYLAACLLRKATADITAANAGNSAPADKKTEARPEPKEGTPA